MLVLGWLFFLVIVITHGTDKKTLELFVGKFPATPGLNSFILLGSQII